VKPRRQPITCSHADCNRPTQSRDLCESHYRRKVRMGIFGYRDATPVLDHLAKLRDLGWTWEQIGDAAGIAATVPNGLWRGRYRRIQGDGYTALLSVPLTPQRSRRGLDSCGTRRRVQALAWMGWPATEVAKRAGIPVSTLQTLIMPTRRISYGYAARVAEVYETLSHLQGPSKVAAGKARGLGFAPPLAWDDDTIDDPAAVPDFGDAPHRRVEADEIRHLRAGGCPDWDIARRLGIAESYLRAMAGAA